MQVSSSVYLIVMAGIIITIAIVATPSLMTKRCLKCRRRNSLERDSCKFCNAEFPRDSLE
jgi:hypothetical protein